MIPRDYQRAAVDAARDRTAAHGNTKWRVKWQVASLRAPDHAFVQRSSFVGL